MGYTYDNVNHVPRFSHGPRLCLIFLFSIEICITDPADSCNRDTKSFSLSYLATIFHKNLIRIFLVKNKTTSHIGFCVLFYSLKNRFCYSLMCNASCVARRKCPYMQRANAYGISISVPFL